MDQNNCELCCVICNDVIDEGGKEEKSDVSLLWQVFCESLIHLEDASQFDDILNYFCSGGNVPFCSTCENLVDSLRTYHEQINQLQEQINKLANTLSSTIVKTAREAEGNPNKSNKTKSNGQNGIKDRIFLMRQQIAKYYSASAEIPIKKQIPKSERAPDKLNKAATIPKVEKELAITIKREVIQSDQTDMVINPLSSSRPKRRISRKHLYDDIHYGDIAGKEEEREVVVNKEKIKTTPTKRVKKSNNISTFETPIPAAIKVENVSPNSEVKERRRQMEWKVIGDKAGKKSFLFDGKWHVTTVVVSNPSGEEMRLQCNTCGAKRRRKPDMTAHIKLRHIDSARYICEVCQKVCHNLSHLKWHKATHKTTSAFNCPVSGCIKKYKDKIHLVQHIKVVHGQRKGGGGKIVKPIESDVIVNEKGEVEEEEDDDDDEEEENEERELEGEELEEDETEEQQQKLLISAPPSTSESGLVILSCKTVTEGKNQQARSKNTKNNIPPCTMEELEDDNEDQVGNEIQVDGLELSPEDDYNEAYDGVPPAMPILIPVHFPTSSSQTSNATTTEIATNSITRHKKWKPLDETGQKSFLYDDQWLVSTVINPSGEVQYYCETCGSKRKRKADMTSHIRLTHIQPLKYVCRICGKVCYHGGHLKWHEATHSQVPNKCSIENCGKVFKSQNHLALHMKTHVIANRRANINNTNNNSLPSPSSPEFPSYGEYLEREENDMDMDLVEEQKKSKQKKNV